MPRLLCFSWLSPYPLEGDHSESFVLLPLVQAEADGKSGHVFGYFLSHGENGLSIGASSAEITGLLKAWSSGDQAALARLAERVQTAALVHEGA